MQPAQEAFDAAQAEVEAATLAFQNAQTAEERDAASARQVAAQFLSGTAQNILRSALLEAQRTAPGNLLAAETQLVAALEAQLQAQIEFDNANLAAVIADRAFTDADSALITANFNLATATTNLAAANDAVEKECGNMQV